MLLCWDLLHGTMKTEDQILLGHDVVTSIPDTNLSYLVAGGQGVCPLQLGALIDSELGVFGVVGAVMCGAEIKRGQSAGRRLWALTWWVRRGRGVDLGEGRVCAAGASFLARPPLKKRGNTGRNECLIT